MEPANDAHAAHGTKMTNQEAMIPGMLKSIWCLVTNGRIQGASGEQTRFWLWTGAAYIGMPVTNNGTIFSRWVPVLQARVGRMVG